MELRSNPAWLDENFVESVIQRQSPNAEISITRIYEKDTGIKGGGYLSLLNNIIVEFTKSDRKGNTEAKKLSLIIKSQPLRESQLEFSVKSNAFIKELSMYQVTLPAMYQIMREKMPDKPRKMFAPHYFSCPRSNTLVLEDLKEKGFMLADRRCRLDLTHSLLVVKTLAQFHALSIVLFMHDPKSMDVYKEGHYIESQRESVDDYFQTQFSALISEVRKWQGYQHFADKIQKVADTATTRMIELNKPSKQCMSVLNHGDVWMNNLLFKYSSTGKPVDVTFVDFQLSRFTFPAIELNFFFYLSLREDVLFQHMDTLVEEYHVQLSDCLRSLNCDPDLITLPQLKQQLEATEPFAVITACSKLWFVLVDPKDVDKIEDFSHVTNGVNPLSIVYADPLMRRAYEKLLPYFEQKGLL